MARSKPQYKDYPLTNLRRGGCKVSWLYYVSEDAAKQASEAAKHNARIDAANGYDFGYCSPGTVTKMTSEKPHGRPELAGKFEVCIS